MTKPKYELVSNAPVVDDDCATEVSRDDDSATVHTEPSPSAAEDRVSEATSRSHCRMIQEIARIVGPADLSSILWMLAQLATTVCVSRSLGPVALAQFTVGIMVFNICGFSILAGLGSAIDTIGSQAFGFNEKSPVVGEVVQVAMLVDILLLIPVSCLFFLSKPLLLMIFGADIGSGAHEFLVWSPPYLLAMVIGGAIRRGLLVQHAAHLVVYANAAAAMVSPLANYLFTPWGVYGAVISLTCIAVFNTLAYVVLAAMHPASILMMAKWPAENLWSAKTLRDFCAVGVPSMIAVCAEWWAFDVLQIFTVFVNAQAVAAFGIGMSLLVMLFSLPLGLSVAASVLVGNALGAGNPTLARRYWKYLVASSVIMSGSSAVTLVLLRSEVASFYSGDETIRGLVVDMMPVVALCHCGDALQFTIQGVFRGAGQQAQTAYAVLGTLALVGLPAAWFFCLQAQFGVTGVFMGLLAGFVVEIPMLLFLMGRWNWDALAEKAAATASNGSGENEMGEVKKVDESLGHDAA